MALVALNKWRNVILKSGNKSVCMDVDVVFNNYNNNWTYIVGGGAKHTINMLTRLTILKDEKKSERTKFKLQYPVPSQDCRDSRVKSN